MDVKAAGATFKAREITGFLIISTPDGIRTHNPWLRRPVPYPLGHWGSGTKNATGTEYASSMNIPVYKVKNKALAVVGFEPTPP